MRVVLLFLLLSVATALAGERSRYLSPPKKLVRTSQEEIRKFYRNGYKRAKLVGRIDGVRIFLVDGKYIVRKVR